MDTLFRNMSDNDYTRININNNRININCEEIKVEKNKTKPDKYFINWFLQDTRVRAIENQQISRKYLLPALYEEQDKKKQSELRILINKSICEEINLLSYVIHDVNENELNKS